MSPEETGVLTTALAGLIGALALFIRRRRRNGGEGGNSRGSSQRPTAGSLPPEFWQMEHQRSAREGARDAVQIVLTKLDDMEKSQEREFEAIRRHLHELGNKVTPIGLNVEILVRRGRQG